MGTSNAPHSMKSADRIRNRTAQPREAGDTYLAVWDPRSLLTMAHAQMSVLVEVVGNVYPTS